MEVHESCSVLYCVPVRKAHSYEQFLHMSYSLLV